MARKPQHRDDARKHTVEGPAEDSVKDSVKDTVKDTGR